MKKSLLFFIVACGLSAGAVDAAPETLLPEQATRCEPSTGSRIALAPDAQGVCDSRAAFTRSYDQNDLQRTGEIDLDAALFKLDPALTRSGFNGGAGLTR